MPDDVKQREGVRVPSRPGQKPVAQSVKSSVQIEFNLITGKLFRETPHFRLEYSGFEFLAGMAGPAEPIPAFGLCHRVFENRL